MNFNWTAISMAKNIVNNLHVGVWRTHFQTALVCGGLAQKSVNRTCEP
jgi:hypothetical protein